MRIANIVPVAFQDDLIGNEDDYHLVLADKYLNSPVYRKFYKNRREAGDFIILDNGAFENRNETPVGALEEAATDLQPDLLVLPDRMCENAFQTAERARNGINRLARLNLAFMAVPHGDGWEDYMRCIRMMERLPINVIGIPEEEEHRVQRFRSEIVAALYTTRFHIHLLGMTEDLADLYDPLIQARCMGVDSCKLVRWGLEADDVRPGRPTVAYPGRGKDYFERTSAVNLSHARSNIVMWREYLHCTTHPRWTERSLYRATRTNGTSSPAESTPVLWRRSTQKPA